jgi:hypothetical protein
MVVICADYRPSPGGGWIAGLVPEGSNAGRQAQFPDLAAAYHGVLDLLDALEEQTGVAFAVVHTLRGDPRAWELTATDHGIVERDP